MTIDNVYCVQKCKQAEEEVFMDKYAEVEGNADMDTMNDTWEDECVCNSGSKRDDRPELQGCQRRDRHQRDAKYAISKINGTEDVSAR